MFLREGEERGGVVTEAWTAMESMGWLGGNRG